MGYPNGIFETLNWLTKKVNRLCCWVKELESNALYRWGSYGSYYSTVDQTNTVGPAKAITLNVVDFQSGISIVNNSQITIANAGKYNIAFSLQLHHTGGGGNGKHVDIWLAKNGTAVPDSNTRVDVDTNTPYQVAAWNFFVDAQAGSYYELMWSTANANIIIEQEVASAPNPGTPSVILTINQFG